MPDESIDFIFTSPPYANQIKDYGATGIKIKPDQFDNWFLPRAQEMYRILKSEGSFCIKISMINLMVSFKVYLYLSWS